jgi:hypothetical protein
MKTPLMLAFIVEIEVEGTRKKPAEDGAANRSQPITRAALSIRDAHKSKFLLVHPPGITVSCNR